MVAWLVYSSDIVKQEDDSLTVAYKRIQNLEDQVDRLRNEFFQASMLIVECQSRKAPKE